MENSVFNELLKTPPNNEKKNSTPCLNTYIDPSVNAEKENYEVIHPRKFNFFDNASPTASNSVFRKINMNPAMDFIKFLEDDIIS